MSDVSHPGYSPSSKPLCRLLLFRATLGLSLLFLLPFGLGACASPNTPGPAAANATKSAITEQLAQKEAEVVELQAQIAAQPSAEQLVEKEVKIAALQADLDRAPTAEQLAQKEAKVVELQVQIAAQPSAEQLVEKEVKIATLQVELDHAPTAEQLAEKGAEIIELQIALAHAPTAEQLAQKEMEIAALRSALDRLQSQVAQPTATPRAQQPETDATTGICDRTPQVQVQIIKALNINSCKAIDTNELFRVEAFDNLTLRSVRPHDLDDLVNLRKLHLRICDAGELPDGLFDDLLNLEDMTLVVKDTRYIPLEMMELLEDLLPADGLEIRESDYRYGC